MLQNQKTSPKPQNPLIGIIFFLFIYLLIKPVPQLVSGKGRQKKRDKKGQRTQWKIIGKCSSSEGNGKKKAAIRGRQSHHRTKMKLF